ncbi:MAG TPA: protease inhibitor I42 family protein [Mucilaginibacter sp.]
MASCKKDSNSDSSVVKINALNNGKTVTLLNGQKLQVTLGNPGDGGYSFDQPQYNSSMLKLNSHINTPPANSKNVGDFGTDTWEFSSLTSGKAALTITATRGSESPIVIFKDTVIVK